MHKLQVLVVILVSVFFCEAQTTEDEYLYASGGYLKAAQLGIGEKLGYSIIDYNGWIESDYFDSWNSQYRVRLLVRTDVGKDSIAAVILEKGGASYCIPHPLSDKSLAVRSLSDFPEFWNTYNEALIFHLLQTAVWKQTLDKVYKGKTILDVEYGTGNNYEGELPSYAQHWGEFLWQTKGRELTYNALATYPEFDCDVHGNVMVKFRITKSGQVQAPEIVSEVYFKEQGELFGTTVTGQCIEDYIKSLITQFTFSPFSISTEEAHVLIVLE